MRDARFHVEISCTLRKQPIHSNSVLRQYYVWARCFSLFLYIYLIIIFHLNIIYSSYRHVFGREWYRWEPIPLKGRHRGSHRSSCGSRSVTLALHFVCSTRYLQIFRILRISNNTLFISPTPSFAFIIYDITGAAYYVYSKSGKPNGATPKSNQLVSVFLFILDIIINIYRVDIKKHISRPTISLRSTKRMGMLTST